MNKMLEKIKKMHEKFNITSEQVHFSQKEKEFRHACLSEEVQEYLEAQTNEEELDALVDLVVFAFGTAERQGWLDIFELAFNRVMQSNMTKEIGANQKRGSFSLDLVKPEGFEPAVLTDLFNEQNSMRF